MARRNPEDTKIYQATYYEKNKEHLKAMARKSARRNRFLREYGITEAQYDKMLEAQNGLCLICEKVCGLGHRLCVDHSHRSGRVRGLLCSRCNSGLGFFRDNADLLTKAATYLNEREVLRVLREELDATEVVH